MPRPRQPRNPIKQTGAPQTSPDALTRVRTGPAYAPYLPVDVRERVYELHLRGTAKAAIARAEGIDRKTVAAYIAEAYREAYRETGALRSDRQQAALRQAVQRLRRIQQQAWLDHDVDDQREQSVMAAIEEGLPAKYGSQRVAYLRVILDAEKEIARLMGLYDGVVSESGAIAWTIIRRDPAMPLAQNATTDA